MPATPFDRLMRVVSRAYPSLGAFPDSYEQAQAHEIGDTLADFVYLELHDCCVHYENVQDLKTEALRAMGRAREDLDEVIEAVEAWKPRGKP